MCAKIEHSFITKAKTCYVKEMYLDFIKTVGFFSVPSSGCNWHLSEANGRQEYCLSQVHDKNHCIYSFWRVERLCSKIKKVKRMPILSTWFQHKIGSPSRLTRAYSTIWNKLSFCTWFLFLRVQLLHCHFQ